MAQAIATVCVGAVSYTLGYGHPFEVFFSQIIFIVFLGGLDGTAAFVSAWRRRRDAATQAAWEQEFGTVEMERDAEGLKVVRGSYH